MMNFQVTAFKNQETKVKWFIFTYGGSSIKIVQYQLSQELYFSVGNSIFGQIY